MKASRNRKVLNRTINILMLISTISVIWSFRSFAVNTVEGNVESVHVTSKDGKIDFYTENASYCRFLELYFDTFVTTGYGELYLSEVDYDVDNYPVEINILTRFDEEFTVLLRESQYDASKQEVNEYEYYSREVHVPTMVFLETKDNINYFLIEGVSDQVLNLFINSLVEVK